MAQRPDNLNTALRMLELLRRIPRGRKVTTGELHQQLKGAGFGATCAPSSASRKS